MSVDGSAYSKWVNISWLYCEISCGVTVGLVSGHFLFSLFVLLLGKFRLQKTWDLLWQLCWLRTDVCQTFVRGCQNVIQLHIRPFKRVCKAVMASKVGNFRNSHLLKVWILRFRLSVKWLLALSSLHMWAMVMKQKNRFMYLLLWI